jgi:RNA polymerase sigma factor (sigma-70 family)
MQRVAAVGTTPSSWNPAARRNLATAKDGELRRDNWLVERFEENRDHLRGVAYRILGTLSDADDAVQEAWLRLSRSDVNSIENLGGWLTTTVARVSLDMLRSRNSQRAEPLGVHLPELDVHDADGTDPEDEAMLADSVGLALLVVLQTLGPAERLAFVLHDMFAMPFAEIAPIIGRSPDAARQLASRARRRVRGTTAPSSDLTRQRKVVDAFLAAARSGDFEALLSVLDPDVVLRAGVSAVSSGKPPVRGAAEVARLAQTFSARGPFSRPALVNGAVGVVVAPRGRLAAVMALTIAEEKITEIEIITRPEELERLELSVLDD